MVCDGVDGVRRAAREQLRLGADQIKVMASGGAMSPADELSATQYALEELRAAVEVGRGRPHLRDGPRLQRPEREKLSRGGSALY